MRIQQTIERAGANLVLTLTEQPSGRVLATRVWENAAQYIEESDVDGYLTIRAPISSELNVKPEVWEW